MSTRLIENPATPFVTSVGVIGLQALSWLLLFPLVVATHRDPPLVLQAAEMVWFFLPLLSVVGILSALKGLRQRRGMALSALGLFLNACYLIAFMLVIFVVFVIGVTA